MHPRVKYRDTLFLPDDLSWRRKRDSMIPWSRRALAAVVVSVGLVSAGLTAYLNLPASPTVPPGPQHWIVFSDPYLEGDPQQNTSDIWVAVIANMGSEEPFSAYEAGLYRDGQALVEPVPLHPGVLGIVGSLWFEFFDYGTMCSPTPCPPPEGPDGLLNRFDYFRLSGVESGASYLVRVYWAESGQIVGEILVNT